MAVHSFSPKGQFQGDIQTMALKLDQSQYCARKKYICVKSQCPKSVQWNNVRKNCVSSAQHISITVIICFQLAFILLLKS